MLEQNNVLTNDYLDSLKANLVDLDDKRYDALNNLQVDKGKITQWYNKKEKFKSFQPGELVYRRLFYLYELKPLNLKNGPLLGKGHLKSIRPFMVELIDSVRYKGISIKGILTKNI